DRLGVTRSTVIAWIGDGHLTARRDPLGRYLVVFGPDAQADCRAHIAASRQIHRNPGSDRQPGPDECTPAQLAAHLGISRDAVYNWIRRGYLAARHGPGGHAYINLTPQVQAACQRRIAESAQLPAAVKAKALQTQTGEAL
ncbi:MAG: helix-turn-helix domain-containing protein, partial [Actinomycetota bacterium]|nr:helix-turn-helix domain-containing protein [Actinomycetota bacterium]